MKTTDFARINTHISQKDILLNVVDDLIKFLSLAAFGVLFFGVLFMLVK